MRSLFLIHFIVAFIIAFVIAFSPPLLAAKTLDKVSLQLQWKHQFEFAGFYAAYEKGYYKQAGLDVEFIEYNEDINIVDAVLSGKAQYGLSYSSIIADYLKGKPLVFIANFLKQSPLVIIASADIKTPKDLAGKKIMGVSNSIGHITLISMLNKFEVGLEDIHSIPASFNIEDFINKKVDAVSVFTSNELFYLQQQGVKYNLFNPTVYGVEYYDVNLFTSNNELIHHPERVQQFKQASIKGWQYALAHKEEIIQLIQKKYNTLHKSREALRFEANQIEQLMMPKIYPIGSIDPHRVKLIADSFIQNGFVDKVVHRDIKAFIYQSEKDEKSYIIANNLLLTEKERSYLAQKKFIKLCIDSHWMPYEQINKNGRYEGIVADIHYLLAKRLGIELQIIKTAFWADSISAIEQGKCDILSAATVTPERGLSMNFSSNYMELPLVIATQNNVPFIDDISLVSDRSFAIVKGHAIAELLLEQYPSLLIVYVDTPLDGLYSVKNGRVFAYIDTPATIAYEIRRNNLINLKIAGKLKQRYKISVAVKDDEPVLLDIYEKAVLSLSDKQLEQTINRWNSIQIVKEFDYQLFGIIFSVLTIIIALILYRYRIIANYNKQLRSVNQKLEKFSMTDQLTGIGNRHAFETLIKKEFVRIKRYNSTLSLIMLDIDYFKSINDAHGHDGGDRVLKTIALLLTDNARKVDEIIRWGGEEFIIICPETDLGGAVKLAEQLRENIENSDMGLGKGEITASFGVTQYQNKETIDSLLKKADTALYRAKNNGRNKVMHLKEVIKYKSLHDLVDR